MPSHRLNILLAEDHRNDRELIREVLAEIEESGPEYGWFACDLLTVDELSDAVYCLEHARFDSVLLDLCLPDSPLLLPTFLQVFAVARGAPVVALLDVRDDVLAHRLLREGAQDVLAKTEIECSTLARSLAFAIEREKRARAVRSISPFDELTGLYNRGGLEIISSQIARAAHAVGALLHFTVVAIGGLVDLQLLDAAGALRAQFEETATIARLQGSRFVVLSYGTREEADQGVLQVEEALRRRNPSVVISFATVSLSGAESPDLDCILDAASAEPATT